MAASSSEHATESLLGRWDVLLPDDECTVFSSFLYICGYNKASSSSPHEAVNTRRRAIVGISGASPPCASYKKVQRSLV